MECSLYAVVGSEVVCSCRPPRSSMALCLSSLRALSLCKNSDRDREREGKRLTLRETLCIHRLPLFRYFGREDPTMRDAVILNSEWLVKVIKSIFAVDAEGK